MAQLSRPYQIALGAMAVLALVWFVALRGHGGSPSEPSAPSVSSTPSGGSPAAKPTGAAQEREAAKPTPVYKGAAPGVEGLTRDVAKAHGAVALSQRKAAELQGKSAQASGEAPSRSGAGAIASSGARSKGAGTPAKGSHAKAPSTPPSHHAGVRTVATTPSRPAQQVQLERELTHGKTVLLVFWNPSSSVDATVRSQALALSGASKGRVVVHVARANQVGLFGPVTEVAHVYQTPTVLIVARHGLVSSLTGLVDTFGLQQAVREAEHAAK